MTDDVNYTAEPSISILDALRLVPLFYTAHWTPEKKAEWLRITGTAEASTKVMCDHIRSAIEVYQPGMERVEKVLAEAHQNVTGSTDHRVDAEESMYAEALGTIRAALGIAEQERQ